MDTQEKWQPLYLIGDRRMFNGARSEIVACLKIGLDSK
jgi:hypothetical protein